MFAEAQLAVEPELVDGVAAVFARLQCVGVAAAADVPHQQLRQCRRVGSGVGRQRTLCRRPLQQPRVVGGRQLHQVAQPGHRRARAVAMLQPGRGLDAHALAERAVELPLPVGPQRRQPSGDARRGGLVVGGHLQQRQQGQLAGLQGHLVAQRLALQLEVEARPLRRREGGCQACPLAAVEVGQHRPAPVHLRRRRQGAREAHAKGDAVVLGQRGDAAHAQAARQPGAAGGVLRQPPQRPDAREQHEQHHHQRQAQRRGARRDQPGAQQRRPAHRQVRQHQRRQQPPHRHQQPQAGAQRLRIQEVREDEEEAQEQHHQRVAPRAQLQRLQRHQHDQHRDARFLAQQRALAPQRQCGGHHQQAGDHPAAGQGTGGPGQPRAPAQQRQGHDTAPDGQVQQVRRDRPADDEQVEQRVARVARQVRKALAQVHRHSASRSSAARRCASP